MDLNRYIQHPEQLNRETLYDLRSYVALYPYHQPARLLMMQNMYLLHDPMFDEELRRAAFYITDRTTLFNMIEARHYTITKQTAKTEVLTSDRTEALINSFLETVPEEPAEKPKRKPTAAEAAVDYATYLAEMGASYDIMQEEATPEQSASETLIDNFLNNEGGKIKLKEEPEYTPHYDVQLENDKDELAQDYHTETLAKIYIKQGKYLQALEIIQHLNLNNSKKNAYFADQMRFLEKIIAIKSHK